MADKGQDSLQSRAAVFLDRDGTIIEDTGFISRPEDVRFLPGAAEGLRRMQDGGYLLIVVSNQSGIARGIFTWSQLEAVHERFVGLLAEAGIRLAECLYCPYHPDGTVAEYRRESFDRKGSPGMILKAASRHGICRARSWMIGDRDVDVQAGTAGGTRTIQIGKAPGTGSGGPRPDFYADNLLAAATIVGSAPATTGVSPRPRGQRQGSWNGGR